MILSKSSVEKSTNLPLITRAALLIRISNPPNSFFVILNRFIISLTFEISVGTVIEVPLKEVIIFWVSFKFSIVLATRTTFTPCLAKKILILLPIPLLAPVTIATLLLRSIFSPHSLI